jgi:hypothetical protein
MSTKTKTTAAAAIAALALPTAAFATDPDHGRGDHRSKDGDRHEQRDQRSGKNRSERRVEDRRRSGADDRGKHKGRHHGRKAFVLAGVDAANLSVSADGKLAGPLTVDPLAANRGARKLLNLTKEQIAGEDTVAFGVAGDGVKVKYKGLVATDALQATDVVTVLGKVDRTSGALDIKKISIKR